MSVAQYSMDLEWKSFPLDLNAVEAHLRANAGASYCGNSAHAKLQLHFLEEPSQDIKDAIAAYWDGLSENSDEAKSYKSSADRAADVAAKKASAKAKLTAMGLTADEVAALVG